jgi:hypothetical protein
MSFLVCIVQNIAEIIMMASWYIWWSRQHIKNKEAAPTPERIIINIKGILAYSLRLTGAGNVIRTGRWMKPVTGVYKLNDDSAFDPDSGRGASGAIIRDGRELNSSRMRFY